MLVLILESNMCVVLLAHAYSFPICFYYSSVQVLSDLLIKGYKYLAIEDMNVLPVIYSD